MKTPLTFLGKCATVLTAAGLSWLTVTNPDVDQLARHLCGNEVDCQTADAHQTFVSIESDDDKVAAEDLSLISVVDVPSEKRNDSPDARIREISAELKQRGASYLLLEKLPQRDQSVQYRARCDLGDPEATIKCCFEAIGETPLTAMESVYRAVAANSANSI